MNDIWTLVRFDFLQLVYGAVFLSIGAIVFLLAKFFDMTSQETLIDKYSETYLYLTKLKWAYLGFASFIYGFAMWLQLVVSVFMPCATKYIACNPLVFLSLILLNIFTVNALKELNIKPKCDFKTTEVFLIITIIVCFLNQELALFCGFIALGIPPFVQLCQLLDFLFKKGLIVAKNVGKFVFISYIIRVFYQTKIFTKDLVYNAYYSNIVAALYISLVIICIYIAFRFWQFAKISVGGSNFKVYYNHLGYLFLITFVACFFLTESFSNNRLTEFQKDCERYATSLGRVFTTKFNQVVRIDEKSLDLAYIGSDGIDDVSVLENVGSHIENLANFNTNSELTWLITKTSDNRINCNGRPLSDHVKNPSMTFLDLIDSCYFEKEIKVLNNLEINEKKYLTFAVPVLYHNNNNNNNNKRVLAVLLSAVEFLTLNQVKMESRAKSILMFMFLIGLPLFVMLIQLWNDSCLKLTTLKRFSNPVIIAFIYCVGITLIATYIVRDSYVLTQRKDFHCSANALGLWLNECFLNSCVDISVDSKVAIHNASKDSAKNIFVNSETFKKFAREYFPKKHKSIWRFIEPVNGREVNEFNNYMKDFSDNHDFEITHLKNGEKHKTRAANNKVFWPCSYVYPEEYNDRLLGIDFSCEIKRANCIKDVLRTNQPTFLVTTAYYGKKEVNNLYSFIPVRYDKTGNITGIFVASIAIQDLADLWSPTKFAWYDTIGYDIIQANHSHENKLLARYPIEQARTKTIQREDECYSYPLLIGNNLFYINFYPLVSNKKIKFFNENSSLFTLASGLICSGFAVFFIVYLKRNEDYLEDSLLKSGKSSSFRESFVKSITSNLPLVTFRLKLDNHFSPLYISKGVTNLLGVTPEQIFSEEYNFLNFVHEKDRDRVYSELQSVITSKKNFSLGFRMIHQETKEVLWVECNGKIRYDKDNKPTAFEGMINDVSDVKRNQLSLSNYVKGLQKANDKMIATAEKAKAYIKLSENATLTRKNLLASISHEIRTPMNIITSMADILKDSNLNLEQRNYVNSLNNSASKLLELINSVLDYSKLEAGKMNLENVGFDLYNIIKESVDGTTTYALAKNLKLIFEFDEKLPKYLSGDPVRIQQIMNILLKNAIDFTSKGVITFRIELVENLEDKVRIALRFKDTGCGLTKEQIEHIFDPFNETSENNDKISSSLGLPIAEKLVEFMGGTMEVESEINRGSTFIVYLTLGVSDECEVTGLCALPKMDPNFKKIYKRNRSDISILLVEDNLTNQKVGKAVLNRMGFFVDVANDGQEALDIVRVNNYDIIFMDCQMPVMNGFEATKQIRSGKLENVNSKIIVIAMTANSADEERQNCIKAGMDDFLEKPFRVDKVTSVLDKYFIIGQG